MSILLTQYQMEKMPRYAASEIKRLSGDLDAANARLAAGPEDSDTFSDQYTGPSTPLGKGARIRFIPAPHQYIDAQLKEGILEIRAQSDIRTHIAVMPRVSNSIGIALIEDPRNG